MNIRDIEAAHQADERITDDPYLPRDKAIARFQRAHYHRGLLLAEVERLREQLQQTKEFQKAIRENQEAMGLGRR